MQKLLLTIRKNIGPWLLIFPAVFCIYFFVLRPQAIGIIWSFFDMKGFGIEKFIGLDNYRRVFADSLFLKTLLNTFQYVFWSLIIGFIVPVGLAIVLNEVVHFREGFRFWVYFPTALPMVAVMLLWKMLYYPDQTGLLNTILMSFGFDAYTWLQDPENVIKFIVISMTWQGCGGTTIYYYSALQNVRRELYEAAIIDGAGFFRRLWTVTMPHLAGIMLLFLIRQIIAVFSVMEQPLQMTDGGPNGASMSLGLMIYKYAFVNGRPQLALAIGTIMFLILIVFTIFYFKINKKIEDSQ